MSVETRSSSPSLTMKATSPIRHLCPWKEGEVDNGTITITWRTLLGTLELHSLREFLRTFANQEVSHESLTDHIRRELLAIPSIKVIDVQTTWDTAGMEVVCST